MQFSSIDIPNNKRFRLVLQVGITLASVAAVIYKLSEEDWEGLEILDTGPAHMTLITLVVLLMPANWLLESYRWRSLIRLHQDITFRGASNDVLYGLMLSWVIPFTLGDVLGRLSAIKNKLKGGISILLARFSSLTVSLLFGTLGLSAHFNFFEEIETLFLVMLMGCFLLVVISFFVRPVIWFQLLWSTILRYLIMLCQFSLLIYSFASSLDIYWVMAGVTWVFLIRSIVPSAWGALGVRELSALIFFECCMPSGHIVLISMMLWIVNLVIPSLVYATYRSFHLVLHRPIV